MPESLTYGYSFISSFELKTFQFVSSLIISRYNCAHMIFLVFVTDIEVAIVLFSMTCVACSHSGRHWGI